MARALYLNHVCLGCSWLGCASPWVRLEVMPRCACDTDANRPCTKRATQGVLARFANALIASQMRSIMPSAGRSQLPTSRHAAQEQCQLPHAIAMATHTAHGVSGQEHKSKCSAAVRRRHQRGSSWQLTTATTSKHQRPSWHTKQHGSQEQGWRRHNQHGHHGRMDVHVAAHSCGCTLCLAEREPDRL